MSNHIEVQKYRHRIAVLSRRTTSGSYGNLTSNQEHLFNVIEQMAGNDPNKILGREDIEKKCGLEFNFESQGNLITDFCYNKVNMRDNENKFLVSPGRGIFRFVGFNWKSQEEAKISWKIRDIKGLREHIVGSYKNGKFHWNFDQLLRSLEEVETQS